MSKLSKLLQVTEEEKQKILKELNVTEEAFEQDVEHMKIWLTKNQHLPQDDDKRKIRVSLLNSKLSLEKAKKTLEGYYRVRTLYSDLFDIMVPNTELYYKCRKVQKVCVMPKLTEDLCRVTICKSMDINGEAEDGIWYYIPALMIAELRIIHDYFLSNIIIVDMEFYGLKNLLKFTPSLNQKLVNILNSINLRIKSIHLINCSPVIDRVMFLIKNILPAKIMEKIHTHPIGTNFDFLHEHISKDCLPKDYGGTEPSLDELYENWCEELELNEEHFKNLLLVKSKEISRIESPTKEDFGMGFEGSFKKLAID